MKKIFIFTIATLLCFSLFLMPALAYVDVSRKALYASTIPSNTSTAVYGEGVILVNVKGNYDNTYSITLTDIKPTIEYNAEAKENIAKVLGEDLSKVTNIYQVEFGQNQGGNFNKMSLPKGGILSIDVANKDEVLSIGAVYKNKSSRIADDAYSFSKDGKRTIITLNFDTNFNYIVFVNDLSLPQGVGGGGIGGLDFLNIDIDKNTLILIAGVFVILAIGIVLAVIFLKKMKKKRAKDWLRRR